MKVFIPQEGQTTLLDHEYLAEGGQARLYARGDRVFKVYWEARQAIPAKKIEELRALTKPNIIRPRGILLDPSGRPIGYTMARVPASVHLARLFTTDYQLRTGLDRARILAFIGEMRKTIAHIHSKGILVVDGNEFNFLVDEARHAIPYFIDVDSYQTPSYPATVIMPSIRDWASQGFSTLTDWFSFGILAFQLLAGIHPFKGRHPDFKKGDFAGRVQSRVSVFHKDVTTPASVRDFRQIPAHYLLWFKGLFERGERTPPPDIAGVAAPAIPDRTVVGASAVNIREISAFRSTIQGARTAMGVLIVRTAQGVTIEKTHHNARQDDWVQIADSGKVLAYRVNNQRLSARRLGSGKPLACELAADKLFRVDNRVYVIRADNLIETQIVSLGKTTYVAAGNQWKLLPNSTRVFDGVLLEDVLGRPHVILPFRAGAMLRHQLPELTGLRIVHARYERRLLGFITATRAGRYDRWLFRWSEGHERYDVEHTADVEPLLNFTVLDTGVVLHIPEDGRLELFSNAPDAAVHRSIEDRSIRSDFHLFSNKGQAAFFRGRRIYAISSK